MTGNFLGVYREVIYSIKASGDVYQLVTRLVLRNLRVAKERRAVEVRCGRVLPLAAFHSVVSDLAKTKVDFLGVSCQRSFRMAIRRVPAERDEAVLRRGGLGVPRHLSSRAIRRFIGLVEAIVRQCGREVFRALLLSRVRFISGGAGMQGGARTL